MNKAEYCSVVESCGCFYLDNRAKIEVFGSDARHFLDRILTNNFKALPPDTGCYSCLCTPKGKILVDLFCYLMRGDALEERFILDCDESLKEKLMTQLKRYIIVEDVGLKDISRGEGTHAWGTLARGALAIVGPLSFNILTSFFTSLPVENLHHKVLEWRGSWYGIIKKKRWGLDGYEIWAKLEILENLRAEIKAPTICGETQEVLRIESKTPMYGIDMDESNMPQEANLDHALNFKKGCYVGQEPIARLHNLGHVNKQLCLFKLEGKGVPAPKTKIFTKKGDEAGVVTSGCYSPKYEAPIALGYIKYAFRDVNHFRTGEKKVQRIY